MEMNDEKSGSEMTNEDLSQMYKTQQVVSCVGIFIGAIGALIFIIDPADICVFAYGAPVNVYTAFLFAVFAAINVLTFAFASNAMKRLKK